MAPLLKTLLGGGARDKELTEEMKAILQEIRQEKGHCDALVKSARASLTRAQELSAPIAKAQSDTDAMVAKLSGFERRLDAFGQLAARFETLDERAERLNQGQRQAETRITHASEDAQRVRSQLEELSHKVDMALDLKERLGAFLELESPFRTLQASAESLGGQVSGAGEQLGRIREQHDRVMDAHKTALGKLEAFERRHEELTRGVQDREHRLAAVEQALRGMGEVRETVEDAKRRLGTLKALGDYVSQKTAALEAQREAVEHAMARADQLDQAMRQIDVGLRQQQENAQAISGLQEQIGAVQGLHETVMLRAREMDQLQRESDEQVRLVRLELTSARDEAKKSVERFEFETRGLDAVTGRVADLRSAVTDFEERFKGLNDSSQLVSQLNAQTESLTGRLAGLTNDAGRLDEEVRRVQGLRRDLDAVSDTARVAGERLARVEEARPAIEAALRDFEQLQGAHAAVKDGLEQTRLAAQELSRARDAHAQTKSWLTDVEQSLAAVEQRADELRKMAPTLEFVQKQVQRVNESVSAIEARRDFVEELHRRMAELGALGGKLDERGHDLETRMDAAEQRFVGLAAQADEAERLGKTMASVTSSLHEAERDTAQIGKAVAGIEARCESVESLAERVRALRDEIEQRQHAVEEATRDLERASELRQEAAATAQELDERAKRLAATVATADRQATRVEGLTSQLEDRADGLRFVEKRMGQFEERLAKWELVEQEIGRSLEQLVTRQTTVEALQADVDRMFKIAEKTATDIRAIAAAQGEIDESRGQLEGVMVQLREVRDLATTLDDRKRQTAQAEERLSRAEALLIDVRSSLETLQGQKVIVDQAVEKAGSLRFLLKQAESMIDGLREERDMTARVRSAVASVQDKDDGPRSGVAKAG